MVARLCCFLQLVAFPCTPKQCFHQTPHILPMIEGWLPRNTGGSCFVFLPRSFVVPDEAKQFMVGNIILG